MRILLVTTSLNAGGAASVVYDIACRLASLDGFDVRVACGRNRKVGPSVVSDLKEAGVAVEYIPHLGNRIWAIHSHCLALFELVLLIARGDYEVVHSHSTIAGIISRFACLPFLDLNVVHHVHGWGLTADMPSWTNWLYRRLERLGSQLSDVVIAVSPQVMRKGVEESLTSADKVVVIENGVDYELFSGFDTERHREELLPFNRDKFVVGCVGRLAKQKDPYTFVRVAKRLLERHSESRFVWVGTGPLRSDVQDVVVELGLDEEVYFAGHQDDVHRWYGTFDVFLLTSLWEGMPLVILEALAAGVPVVATDVDGVVDVVTSGETGLLASPRKVDELVDNLDLLRRDKDLRTTLIKNGNEVARNLSKQKMIDRVVAVYEQLE